MSGWVLAWLIGGGVVVIVVGLLLLMIRGAGRAAGKAGDVLAALEDARTHTNALWSVNDTNHAASRIVVAAAAARNRLEGGVR